jgi:hypothetical protein
MRLETLLNDSIVFTSENHHFLDTIMDQQQNDGSIFPFSFFDPGFIQSSSVDLMDPNLPADGDTPKKKNWKKPKDMPKRPLSAYNIFFAHERKRLMEEDAAGDSGEGKMEQGLSFKISPKQGSSSSPPPKRLGFAGLARSVASKWKTLDPEAKSRYEKQASIEKARYKELMKEYNEQQAIKAQHQIKSRPSPDSTTNVASRIPRTLASQRMDNSMFSLENTNTRTLDPAFESTRLVQPKGYYMGVSSTGVQFTVPFPSHVMNNNNDQTFDNLKQSASSFRRKSSGDIQNRPTRSDMINWDKDGGLARRLSSPASISLLAAELDNDQVDFLQTLRSPREEEEDDSST